MKTSIITYNIKHRSLNIDYIKNIKYFVSCWILLRIDIKEVKSAIIVVEDNGEDCVGLHNKKDSERQDTSPLWPLWSSVAFYGLLWSSIVFHGLLWSSWFPFVGAYLRSFSGHFYLCIWYHFNFRQNVQSEEWALGQQLHAGREILWDRLQN